MGRSGKNRGQVRRGKGGRKKPEYFSKAMAGLGAKWARWQIVARKIADDPRLVSPMGRAAFMDEITPDQFQAGLAYGAMLDVYDWKILNVRRTPPAINLDYVGGRDDIESWSAQKILDFRQQFEELEFLVRIAAGDDGLRRLKAYVRGSFERAVDVQPALQTLSSHYFEGVRLDKKRKSPNHANCKNDESAPRP